MTHRTSDNTTTTMASTVEDYLRAKVKQLEASKSDLEFELFRLKHNGGVEATLTVEMQSNLNNAVEAASKKVCVATSSLSLLPN